MSSTDTPSALEPAVIESPRLSALRLLDDLASGSVREEDRAALAGLRRWVEEQPGPTVRLALYPYREASGRELRDFLAGAYRPVGRGPWS